MGWGATRSGKRPLLGFSGWKESSKQSKTKNPGNKNRSQPVHGLQSAPGTGRVGSRDTAQRHQQHVLRHVHFRESKAVHWLQRITVLTGTPGSKCCLIGICNCFCGGEEGRQREESRKSKEWRVHFIQHGAHKCRSQQYNHSRRTLISDASLTPLMLSSCHQVPGTALLTTGDSAELDSCPYNPHSLGG